jgi:hypothetical protein
MAEFKTGRTRTITVEWVLGGTAHIEYAEFAFPTPPAVHLQLPSYECNFFGFTLSGYTDGGGYLEPEDFRTLTFSHVLIHNDWDLATVTADGPPREVGFAAGEGPYTVDIGGGAASLTLTVEEWGVVEAMDPDTDPATLVYGSPFPTFGGGAFADGIPGVKIRYEERAGEDCTAVAHIDCGGASVDYSVTIPEGAVLSYPVYSYVAALAQASTATFSNAATFNGIGLSQAYTPSDSTHSADGSATSATAIESSGTLGASSVTELRSSISQKIQYSLSGRLRAQGSAYPDSQDCTWVCKASPETITLSPEGSLDLDQLDYELYATFDGTPQTGIALHEQNPTYVYLDPSGEDSRDWRLQIAGTKWDALTIAWADRTIPSTTLSGDDNYTVTLSGDDRAPLCRFLKLTGLTVDTDQTVTVSLAGHSWQIAADTGTTTYYIDLCRASDETETERYKVTRFPLDEGDTVGFPTNGHPEETYALGWGVEWATSLGIAGEGDASEIGLTSAQYVSTSRKRFTLLAPFALLDAGWTSETDVTTLQRYGLLECDGRVVDWPHAALVEPTTGADPYWRVFSISEFAGMLAYGPNWSTTPGTPPDDDYHDDSLPAYLLGGGGATIDPVTGDAEDWYDRDPTTIPAQDLWDMVQVYPGAGEVWTAGDYDVTTHLRFSKSLRAQGTGILFDPSGVRESGATAELRRVSDNALRGTGTTDSLGYYATGDPWGVGHASHRLNRPAESGPTFDIANRMRHRATVAGSVVKSALCILHSYEGSYWRATIDTDGLKVRTALRGGPKDGWFTVALVSSNDQDREASLSWDPTTHRATLLWQRDDGIYEAYSDSDGDQWSDPALSITDGMYPRIGHSLFGDGLIVAIVDDSGGGAGKLVAKYRAPGDTDWSTQFDLLDDAGDPFRPDSDFPGFDISASPDTDGRWSLALRRSGESTVSDWLSVNDGYNWLPAS